MTPTAATPGPCPCNCGQEIPQEGRSTWRHAEPYWMWMCINSTCKWRDQLYMNQTGDRTCSMCSRPRVFVGHFDPIASRGVFGRVTVLGEHVTIKTAASYYFKGHGMLDNDGGPGFGAALAHEPLGDDRSQGIT